ncbi:MAG: TRAP transporter large permease [Pseudomonadota bacterium]|nr:TRAP transporter large permease [Pseudomonadota bacterium]
MDAVTICLLAFLALGILIYSGMHISTALFVTAFVGLWWDYGNLELVVRLLGIAATGAISSYEYGVIPLFVLMGYLVLKAGIGADTYAIANRVVGWAPGGLGHATVVANALFAAVTGVSIASAVLFTKISVPEMVSRGYSKRFAVGVVAGSSMLGMLIPPSVLMVFFAILTNTSIGSLFIAGIVPGILLSLGFVVVILFMALRHPERFGRGPDVQAAANEPSSEGNLLWRAIPVALLIALVLGGIYEGFFTPTEAGAVGAAGALIVALVRRVLSPRSLWDVLLDTAYTTASLVILIISASMFSRFIATAGLTVELTEWLHASQLGVTGLILCYVALILVLGAVLDSISIMLIVVPIFSVVFKSYGVDLVWIGIITTLAIEIGLLTPPFGMAAFVIKATMPQDDPVTAKDVFVGAAPFALIALAVIGLLIAFPTIATGLVK